MAWLGFQAQLGRARISLAMVPIVYAKEGLTWLGLDSSGLAMAQLGRAQISLAIVTIVFRVIAMTGAPLGLPWLWRRLDAIGLASSALPPLRNARLGFR